MARTIFDTPEPRRPRGPYRPIGVEDTEPAKEKEVAADPRLTRAVVGYLEPREGIDGKEYFGRCASCVSFIPESAMRGVVRGDRCSKFGSDFPVTDDSGCDLWTPNADGKPCGHCVAHMAENVIRGERASVSPFAVNFVRDKRRQCMTCRQLDFVGDKPTCALMAKMNKDIPAVFDLLVEVRPAGKCNLWCDFPAPEAADVF